ncbi:MAG: ABC transporter permease, partial [Mesorhizobium sp.]
MNAISNTAAVALPVPYASDERGVITPAVQARKTARRRGLALGRAIPFGALLGPALLLVIWSIG